MLSVIIAAGALFTAVYDVLYKYNTTNTTILNAATVDKRGETWWNVTGSAKNGNETTTCNFDDGTYIVIPWGQGGGPDINIWTWDEGHGAACLAFYKGNSMTVTIGVPGGKGGASDGSRDGSGATYVQSNFALPMGTSAGTAIASGAGGGSFAYQVSWNTLTTENACKIIDGTFSGLHKYSNKFGEYTYGTAIGRPATQTSNGGSPNADETTCSGGGGGFYYGGSGGTTGDFGGGGSCSPNCYPVYSSDIQNGPKYPSGEHAGEFVRASSNCGGAHFRRIDPERTPIVNNAVYGNTALVSDSNTLGNRYTPVSTVQLLEGDSTNANYDCGIRVGWVYSCSEDGEKWGGEF